MANSPNHVDPQQLTIVARRVLLDGLSALSSHLEALTVVGAQAVYLRTPTAAIRSAPFTSDGDLSVDPLLLDDQPLIDRALHEAGFELMQASQPGLWVRNEQIGDTIVPVELDLLVPKTLAEKIGKRSAKIPPHGAMSARWVPGLEVAAVDRSPMRITSLDPTDDRRIVVNVADPAALLIAKAFKINDRLSQATIKPDRLTNKDAGDVLRIMTAISAREVALSLAGLRDNPRIGKVTEEGIELLYKLFGGRATSGVNMAVEALKGDVPEDRVRTLAPAFIERLR
jgi:hypothetical protein